MSRIDTSTAAVNALRNKEAIASWTAAADMIDALGAERDALVAERDALRAAVDGVLAWDARRKYPIPYATRDTLVAAMKGRDAPRAAFVSGIRWATAAEKDEAVLRARSADRQRAQAQLAQGQEDSAPRPCKAREGVLRDVSGQAPAGTEYLDPGMGMAGDPAMGGE